MQITEMKPSRKYAARAILIAMLFAGLALLAVAVRTPDAPAWWWVLGAALVLVGGGFVVEFVRFRLRYPTPEAREQFMQKFLAESRAKLEVLQRAQAAGSGDPDRLRIAREAIRHKHAVLATGTDGTAVVTFLADGRYGDEVERLVYLELEVTTGDGAPYLVRTGEYLTAASCGSVAPGRTLDVKVDPDDPQRVAVDWERSLRLKVSG